MNLLPPLPLTDFIRSDVQSLLPFPLPLLLCLQNFYLLFPPQL